MKVCGDFQVAPLLCPVVRWVELLRFGISKTETVKEPANSNSSISSKVNKHHKGWSVDEQKYDTTEKKKSTSYCFDKSGTELHKTCSRTVVLSCLTIEGDLRPLLSVKCLRKCNTPLRFSRDVCKKKKKVSFFFSFRFFFLPGCFIGNGHAPGRRGCHGNA